MFVPTSYTAHRNHSEGASTCVSKHTHAPVTQLSTEHSPSLNPHSTEPEDYTLNSIKIHSKTGKHADIYTGLLIANNTHKDCQK